MKLMFVYWIYEDQGSGGDLAGYMKAARELGHEIVVYGPPNPRITTLDFAKRLDDVHAVVFVFEWTTALEHGDRLDWIRLVQAVPRERRVVIDCDGGYNDMIHVDGDHNHDDVNASQRWIALCDSLSDKIFQPSLQPRRPNVRPFFFHLYNPAWEAPLDFANKEFGMIYVGHSKFRWRPMERVLRAVAPVRERLGRIALVGHGWDQLPRWARPMGIESHYRTDVEFLQKLDVEVLTPVPFAQVVPTMSRGFLNPVVYRPLFEELGFVTCRTFETIAAGTLPLLALKPDYVRAVYGEQAEALVLPADAAHEKIVDMLERPAHYRRIVQGIRAEFARLHSPTARLRQLLDIIES